jgi:hypothetical protein
MKIGHRTTIELVTTSHIGHIALSHLFQDKCSCDKKGPIVTWKCKSCGQTYTHLRKEYQEEVAKIIRETRKLKDKNLEEKLYIIYTLISGLYTDIEGKEKEEDDAVKGY